MTFILDPYCGSAGTSTADVGLEFRPLPAARDRHCGGVNLAAGASGQARRTMACRNRSFHCRLRFPALCAQFSIILRKGSSSYRTDLARCAARVALRVPSIFIFVFHTTMLWLWHLPLPYAWALSGSIPYWIMEIPLFLSSAWLWKEMLDARRPSGGTLWSAPQPFCR
ncbi:hypothetical protein [Rhizobium leguminosarum]|uniref:hypothetical protein n=1 Tax=Rhizobium leguminosarum TaxID=384 RepID=UPI001FD93A28|nr:hypothetical protein [Rhizobium leguminosarum]